MSEPSRLDALWSATEREQSARARAREEVIARLQSELARLTTTSWKCESCGAEFPHIPHDENVARCTPCVTVELQGRAIDQLRTELCEVASQRDRLKAQVLRDTADDDWRAKINAALAPLIEYEDGVLVDDDWQVEVAFDEGDRPPLRLKGELNTDHACERWEAELREVDWEASASSPPGRLVYSVRAMG